MADYGIYGLRLRSLAGLNFQILIYTKLGMVELCAKILQIMRNDFKDYAVRALFANYAHIMRTFFGFVLHIIGIRQ